MKLDANFEQALNSELSNKHAAKRLPTVFARELEKYETSQVIDRSEMMDYSNRTQLVETELEHVVRAFKRPSLLIKNGQIESSTSEHWRDVIEHYSQILSVSAQSIGRIELKNHGFLAWSGTGFLISGNRVLTNRHVANDFIEHNGEEFIWKKNQNTGKYIRGRIDFLEEYQNPNEDEYEIIDVEYIANRDELDFAILKLDSTPQVTPLSLSTNLTEDTMILTVGYPWRDSRVESRLEEIHKRIFNDIYDVKRAAPGKIISLGINEFSHDCSTLGGNSGSACLDIETGEVVGIHYGGQYIKNLAISSSYLMNFL